jgi:predicted outer membrane protein
MNGISFDDLIPKRNGASGPIDGGTVRPNRAMTFDDLVPQQQTVAVAGKADRTDYQAPHPVYDVLRSAGTGLRQGVEGIVGMAGDAQDLTSRAGGFIAEQLGASPETVEMATNFARLASPLPPAPTTEQIRAQTTNVIGENYLPQTTAGQYAKTIGEFAPAAAVPGGVARRLASTVVPAVASEAAGQAAEGTGFETEARFAGALAGGLASAGRTSTGSIINKQAKQAAKAAPSQKMLSQRTNEAYSKLRESGIEFDQTEYARLVRDIAVDARRKGYRKSTHQDALNVIEDLAEDLSGPIDFDTINGRISALGQLARDSSAKGDKRVAESINFIRNRLMGFEANAPFVSQSGISGRQKAALVKEAKTLALRNAKARELNEAVASADVAAGGVEAGVRNGIRSLLRSKRGRSMFKGDERALLLQVANGRKPLQQLSRLGFDITQRSGNAIFMPVLGSLAAGSAGGLAAGAIVPAVGTAAKIASPILTQRALDRAGGAIRAGKLVGKNDVQRERLLTQTRRLLSGALAN